MAVDNNIRPDQFISGVGPAQAASKHEQQNNPHYKNGINRHRENIGHGVAGLDRGLRESTGAGHRYPLDLGPEKNSMMALFQTGNERNPVTRSIGNLPMFPSEFDDEAVVGGGVGHTNYTISIGTTVDPLLYGLPIRNATPEQVRLLIPKGTLLFRYHFPYGPANQLPIRGEGLIPLPLLNLWMRFPATSDKATGTQRNSFLDQIKNKCPQWKETASSRVESAMDFFRIFSFHGAVLETDLSVNNTPYRGGSNGSIIVNSVVKGNVEVHNVWGRSSIPLAGGSYLWLILRKVLLHQEEESLSWRMSVSHDKYRQRPDDWYFQLFPHVTYSREPPEMLAESPAGRGACIYVGRLRKQPQYDFDEHNRYSVHFAQLSNTNYNHSRNVVDVFSPISRASSLIPPLEIAVNI